MTTLNIPEVDTRLIYTVGPDPTSSFSIPFPFFIETDVECALNGISLTYTDDYTVVGVPTDGGFTGGTLILNDTVHDCELTVYRRIPINRLTNFPLAGPFNIDQLNTELNRIIAINQQLLTLTGLFLSLPETASSGTPFDAGGRAIVNLVDNASANAAVTRGYIASLGAADNQIFFGPVPPTAPSGGFREGDLWFDTSDENHPYIWDPILNGGLGGWNSVRDGTIGETYQLAIDAIDNAATAQATADGKVTTYYSPTAPWADGTEDKPEGDLWFNTTTDKLYRWDSTGETQWVLLEDAGITEAIDAAGDAQTTADGKITTYYAAAAPAGLTATDVGDLWFDTDDNNLLYRWSGADWVEVADERIGTAITNAASALSLADGKIDVYYLSTAPWANGDTNNDDRVGDLWYRTTDGFLFRWSGVVTVPNRTWDRIQDEDIITAISDAATAQSTADGKITSWYSDEPPWANGSTHDLEEGDYWIDTNDYQRPWRWNSASKTWNDVTPIQGISGGQATGGSLAATLLYAGEIELDDYGHIRAGQTAYNTGIGFWLGMDFTTPKFSIGNSAGSYLLWTGSAVEVRGTIRTAGSGIRVELTYNDTLPFWVGTGTRNTTNAYACVDSSTGEFMINKAWFRDTASPMDSLRAMTGTSMITPVFLATQEAPPILLTGTDGATQAGLPGAANPIGGTSVWVYDPATTVPGSGFNNYRAAHRYLRMKVTGYMVAIPEYEADPTNHVWSCSLQLYRSVNGGSTWTFTGYSQTYFAKAMPNTTWDNGQQANTTSYTVPMITCPFDWNVFLYGGGTPSGSPTGGKIYFQVQVINARHYNRSMQLTGFNINGPSTT